ncbi:MAG: putative zinc-binding protein [Desulfuromonadaceae bacterium]|nr:putative zinc-binding protein [Desulfuromonadaceae bacterium]
MNSSSRKVAIVPCSGIGKPYGTVSRVAAYLVTENDRPGRSRLVPLALLVMGDEEYGRFVAESRAITIDGCPLACATKMVRQSNGRIVRECSVMETFRRHRELKPQGIAELNEDGEKLAEALAQEIDAVIDTLISQEEGGSHA